jgi:hypothetical protein
MRGSRAVLSSWMPGLRIGALPRNQELLVAKSKFAWRLVTS